MILAMLIPLLSVFWLHSVSPVDAHAVTRDNVGCGFHLSCSGAFNGSIGQKSSGQARASSDVSPSLFTWFGDAFADQQGSGCWWTPPTFTLQCDKNQQPDHGFEIGCDDSLSFGGQTVFYECPTGEGDEVNIYLRPNGGQCHEITIHADSCVPSTCPGGGAGPFPGVASSGTPSGATPSTPSSPSTPGTGSPPPPSPPTPQGPPTPSPFTTGGQPTTTTRLTSTSTTTTTQPPAASSSGCVEVAPDSIILTDQGNPGTAYGPNAAHHIQVSPNASSIFNFVFADADVGKTCELSFRVAPDSTNSAGGSGSSGRPLNLTGTGIVTLAVLDDWADANTTYDSAPRVIETMANVLVHAGLDRAFGAFPCPGSAARAAVLMSEGPVADTCLDCEQGGGTGMFLRKC